MHRFTVVAAALAVALGGLGLPETAGAQTAPADWLLDCGEGTDCQTIKYGLGDTRVLPSGRVFDKSEIPIDDFRFSVDEMGGNRDGISYSTSTDDGGADFYSRGAESNAIPVPGQVLVREDLNCTPTAEGPVCLGGANDGQACTYTFDSQIDLDVGDRECGTGTCVPGAGGCRVMIPIADAGIDPPEVSSELWIGTLSPGTIAGIGEYQISSATGNAFGATSQENTCDSNSTRRNLPCDPDAADPENPVDGCPTIEGLDPAQCLPCWPIYVRPLPSMGTRYLLPDGHPERIDGTETYVRWDHGLRAQDVVGDCTDVGAPFECCTGAGTGDCDSADADAVAAARAASTNLRLHTDDSGVCGSEFNPPNNGAIELVFRAPQPLYPDLIDRTCRLTNRWITDANKHADWIFVAGANSRFYSDPGFSKPQVQVGLCKENRSFVCYAENDPDRGSYNDNCLQAGFPAACCTGFGTGNCTDPCNDDAAVCNLNGACIAPGQAIDTEGNIVDKACCTDLGTGTCGAEDGVGQCDALQGLSCTQGSDCDLDDECDYSEFGIRSQIFCQHDANGDVPATCGATSGYHLRGVPGGECALLPRREVNGDPGPDCGVINYRVDHRYDGDCNGLVDADEPGGEGDLCPWLSEWSEGLDTGGIIGRGDACECGDHNGDGAVNINDILFTNAHIFGGPLFRLCDADNSGVVGVGETPAQGCNINDILAQNASIFGRPGTCRQVKPGKCGDGVVDPDLGEACDNGVNNNDFGPCNTICQLVP